MSTIPQGRTLLVGWLIVAQGCGSNGGDEGVVPETDTEETDADTDADADGDADTDADTDTEVHAFTPSTVLLSAWFGYDAEQGALVDVVSPYGTVESRIRLEVGDAEWAATGFDSYRTELYCVVELPLTDPGVPPWAQGEPGIWYGVAYTGAEPDSDCDEEGGYDVDPAAYAGFPDLASALAAEPWGVGVGEISPANAPLVDYLAAYPYDVIPAGAMVGGYARDGLRGSVTDQIVAVAYPVDDRGFVDYTTFLDAAEIRTASGLASGFYRMYFLYSDQLE